MRESNAHLNILLLVEENNETDNYWSAEEEKYILEKIKLKIGKNNNDV